MVTTILSEPDFAEWMFLFALVAFLVALWLSFSSKTAKPAWLNTTTFMLLGLALLALGFLAL